MYITGGPETPDGRRASKSQAQCENMPSILREFTIYKLSSVSIWWYCMFVVFSAINTGKALTKPLLLLAWVAIK